ncbi:hypothetical protein P691DRAFT_804665 [Macrolepiota fuliginosa MF-IS2]|uniref:Uncharacterized protein n=1 Tax=Macrolepiota fuliginosa MF-IS2 TaxID=1400762 RepID=A0A9P5XAM8_9AGAR|nr:hypothetical protein P691DRAFT_804665 [Macrolepiota fuliginosa MF-IS2]
MQALIENASTPSSSVVLGASLLFLVKGWEDTSEATPTTRLSDCCQASAPQPVCSR